MGQQKYTGLLSEFMEDGDIIGIHSLDNLERVTDILLSFTDAQVSHNSSEIISIKGISFQFSHIPENWGPFYPLLYPKDSSSLTAISSIFSSLTSLNLNGCTNLSDNSLHMLAQSPHFQSLSLTHLSMYWVPYITDKGILNLFTTENESNSCTLESLTNLSLSGMSKLTDLSLSHISQHCPLLEDIDLTKLSKITDSGLQSLSSHCPLLKSVNLYACCGFSDIGIESIASNCAQLEQLDLAGAKISDRSIAAVASGCPLLSVLNLRWCVALTDKSMEQLSGLCHLSFLTLFGIQSFTDRGLSALGSGSLEECLTRLDINGCVGITDKSTERVSLLFPLVLELEPIS